MSAKEPRDHGHDDHAHDTITTRRSRRCRDARARLLEVAARARRARPTGSCDGRRSKEFAPGADQAADARSDVAPQLLPPDGRQHGPRRRRRGRGGLPALREGRDRPAREAPRGSDSGHDAAVRDRRTSSAARRTRSSRPRSRAGRSTSTATPSIRSRAAASCRRRSATPARTRSRRRRSSTSTIRIARQTPLARRQGLVDGRVQDRARRYPQGDRRRRRAHPRGSDRRRRRSRACATSSRRKGVQWHEYEPISWDNERDGTKLAFKRPLRPIAKLDQCETIVSIDCDLFVEHPASMKYSRDFARSRRKAVDSARHDEPAVRRSRASSRTPARWRIIACRCAPSSACRS